ncbi:MAG: BamA/TamA family outer membrane protein [Clostridiales bacterium]|nr:BamA/TamA family outer membrane protein [Clostridiales bacterium]
MQSGRRLMKWISVCAGCILFLTGCSSTRHVPQGEYLLDRTRIIIEDAPQVQPSSLENYLRQMPNHKVLGFAKMQLGVYNMSGRDSTKWYNRWARRLGEAPVVYDEALAIQSARQLRQAMINRGYSNVTVSFDTLRNDRKRKLSVVYHVAPGVPQTIGDMKYTVADSAIREIIMADTTAFLLRSGDLFDRNTLDAERTRLTQLMRDNGYYTFAQEYITFIADTSAVSRDVDLEMVLRQPRVVSGDSTVETPHRRYLINKVFINTDAEAPASTPLDTVYSRGYHIVYGPSRYLRPSILDEKCYLQPGQVYSLSNVQRTYEAMSQLGIIKFINITFSTEGTDSNGDELLDAHIMLSRTKTHSVMVELEGTNSEGDLGVGAGVTYQHRNLAKHSELLSVKVHGSYESLSGNLEGLINNRYTEVGAEVGITFPKFEAPILKKSYRQRIKASTEFNFTFNHQERPEYTRIIAGAGMKYKWNNRENTRRRTFDLIDINFVYLPKSTIDFINTIAPSNPLLRYSYEDHFIMRMGYTFYKTNRPPLFNTTARNIITKSDIYTFRMQAEMAGNLLYLISSVSNMRKHDDAYKVFGIQYAQYVKGQAGYTINHYFNSRNSISLHAEAGVVVPYGNSSMVPFEKRFYAGGANGVRGWGVRTLGPGRYDSRNSVSNFINQCGDISLFLSMEYRSKLFWVLEGALFVDAGNIWTIRDYETQPNGVFKFNDFYKEIALGYGAGVRFDFTYFLLRLDLGFKAHNPAANQKPWPLVNPNWKRDATFHFSVGYPF